jgi:hypothetical protein
LALETLLLMLTVRIMLWIVPFSWWRGRLKHMMQPASTDAPVMSSSALWDIAWSVQGWSSKLPKMSCLVQAIVGNLLLKQRHQPSRLMIGVMRRGDEFQAHAWLVTGEYVLLGNRADLGQYTVLSEPIVVRE